MTFRQAVEVNAHVKIGEKGSLVVYASSISRTETDTDTSNEVEREIPFVFNVEQIKGLPAQYYAKAEPRLDTVQRIDGAGSFFAATGARIHHGDNQAFYTMPDDRVQMPPFESFQDAESYYATLAHEVTHWTRHPKRLERDFGRKRWGDEGYAMEENSALLSCPQTST